MANIKDDILRANSRGRCNGAAMTSTISRPFPFYPYQPSRPQLPQRAN